jgi:hypothetical protein
VRDLASALGRVHALSEARGQLDRAFAEASFFLRRWSKDTLLATLGRAIGLPLLWSDDVRTKIHSVDHVGLVLPPNTPERALRDAAVRAGFTASHRVFPSTVIARELGAFAGVDQVATTIHIVESDRGSDGVLRLELLVPSPAPSLEPAIRAHASGIPAHVALRVERLADIAHIAEILRRHGGTTPRFMSDRAMSNSTQRVSLEYVDFAAGDSSPSLRIELLHANA